MGRRRCGRALLAMVAPLALTMSACTGTAPPGQGSPAPTARTGPPSGTTPSTGTAPAAGAEGVPAFGHVFVVVMENLSASGAMAVPQIAALARRFESTTDWYGLSHPSLPNYLGLVSGSTWGVTSDCTGCTQPGPDLATQLDDAGITWGGYFGGLPHACFLGPQSPDGSYAQKHDPFAYFDDVRNDKAACAHLQPLDALAPLLSGPADAVPRFVWVTPTMCDSGHDCSAGVAGAWLTGFVDRVTASAAWREGGLLVVTWDEGDGNAGVDPRTGAVTGSGGGAVLTVVAAPGLAAGRVLRGPFGHYSLLRSIEDAFGLSHLAAAGSPGVRAMGAFFTGGGG